MKTHKKREGWANKGKGLLQVLWERGFIDETKLSEYKKQVVDEDGNVVPEFSLVHLMAAAPDFVNETSQVEHVCMELGKRAGVEIKAMISTKYHAEYAGEGIEYSWAFSKSLYRRHPLVAKKQGRFSQVSEVLHIPGSYYKRSRKEI